LFIIDDRGNRGEEDGEDERAGGDGVEIVETFRRNVYCKGGLS